MSVRIILRTPDAEPEHMLVEPPAAIPVAGKQVVEFPDLDAACSALGDRCLKILGRA